MRGIGTLWRFFDRHGITWKKDRARGRAGSRGHRRTAAGMVAAQPLLDPARLVFIDETWASTNMARRYGQGPRGDRLHAGIPHGHWKPPPSSQACA
jgi:hypothetical protein